MVIRHEVKLKEPTIAPRLITIRKIGQNRPVKLTKDRECPVELLYQQVEIDTGIAPRDIKNLLESLTYHLKEHVMAGRRVRVPSLGLFYRTRNNNRPDLHERFNRLLLDPSMAMRASEPNEDLAPTIKDPDHAVAIRPYSK